MEEREEYLNNGQIRDALENGGQIIQLEDGSIQIDVGFINTKQRVLTESDLDFNIKVFELTPQTLAKLNVTIGQARWVEIIFKYGVACAMAVFFWQVVLGETQRNKLTQVVKDVVNRPKPLLAGNDKLSFRNFDDSDFDLK